MSLKFIVQQQLDQQCLTRPKYSQMSYFLFAGETVKDSPLIEHFIPEPLISYYVSWILIGRCGVTVSLLLLPPLCPAKNNDVTLVAMVHSGASRSMPERGEELLLLCLGGHAKSTLP